MVVELLKKIMDVVVVGGLEVEMEEFLEVGAWNQRGDGYGGGLKEGMVEGFVVDGDFDGGGKR